ncbi:hypothetical protein [Sorangium sp. So ce388]|uniref:hypothetical protein n=1 Tax=Sorangium sp. So ce388 TaxID=3133309 RepID=UPI003F5B4668
MLKMKHLGSLFGVALIGATAAGCYGAEGDDGAIEAASEEETFTGTVVAINDDGSQTVTTEHFTRAEQLEWQRLRAGVQRGEAAGLGTAEQASVITASCSNGNALWLYDNTGGSGNMLCLIESGGAGSVILRDYPRGPGTWSGAVKSYWPGIDSGFFYNGLVRWCQSQTASFAAWGPLQDLVGYSTTHSLRLGDTLCSPG